MVSLQWFQLACSVENTLLPNIDGLLPLNTHLETAIYYAQAKLRVKPRGVGSQTKGYLYRTSMK
jgi:hypothetical protein